MVASRVLRPGGCAGAWCCLARSGGRLGRSREASLDAISVSNVPDWLARDEHRVLRAALVRALAPGGRVLARSILGGGGSQADGSQADGSLGDGSPAGNGSLVGDGSLAGGGLVRDSASDAFVPLERTALYGRVDLLRPG